MKKTFLALTTILLIALAACSPQQPQEVLQPETEQTTKQMQIDARPSRPTEKEEQLKWLVCELQHRQFIGQMKLQEQDLSDIIEENDDMELIKIYMRTNIASKQYYIQYYKGVEWLKKTIPGPVEILEENDNKIVADMYAQTVFRDAGADGMNSMGCGYKVTFKKVGNNYVIADCEIGDKGYLYLKNDQQKYMKQGMSKAEANQKIYEDYIEQLSRQSTTSTTT